MTDQRLRDLYQHALDARRDDERGECPAPEQLLALVRREGSEEERLRTLDHTMSCAECLRELDLLRAIENAGARKETSQASSPRALVSWRRAVPLALAASLLLAVGLVVRGRHGASPELERTRGSDAQLVVHSPRDIRFSRTDSLVVAWRPEPSATRYTFEVLDDAGRATLTETTTDTVLVVRNNGRILPGREYQWWVRAFGASGAQASSPLGRLRVIDQ